MAGILAGAGVLVGPSLGHFYAGCERHGWSGIAIRSTVAAAGAGIAFGLSAGESGFDRLDAAAPLIAIGGLVVLGHAIFDMSRAAGCARRTGTPGSARFEITPRVTGPNGLQAVVAARF